MVSFSLTGMVLMGGWVSEKLNGVEMDRMALRMRFEVGDLKGSCVMIYGWIREM